MPISINNLRALSIFAAVADEYCRLIDALPQGGTVKLYSKLEELLPRLQTAILPVEKELPRRKHHKFKKLSMTFDQHQHLGKALSEVVGKETFALFEQHGGMKPEANEVEQYCSIRASMLWDDLADIYRDLHNGLALWNLGTEDSQAEATWPWRFNYEAHWGKHLFRAMTTVHEARYQLYED